MDRASQLGALTQSGSKPAIASIGCAKERSLAGSSHLVWQPGRRSQASIGMAEIEGRPVTSTSGLTCFLIPKASRSLMPRVSLRARWLEGLGDTSDLGSKSRLRMPAPSHTRGGRSSSGEWIARWTQTRLTGLPSTPRERCEGCASMHLNETLPRERRVCGRRASTAASADSTSRKPTALWEGSTSMYTISSPSQRYAAVTA